MKKAINILKTIGSILFWLALGQVLGWLTWEDVYVLSETLQSESAVYIVFLALGYVAYNMQTVFHEAGHMLFGFLSGYKFVSFRVRNLIWIKQDGKIRLKRYHLPGTAGSCGMEPPDMKDGKFPVFLYYMGGALMDLIVCVLCAQMYYVLAFRYWMAGVLTMYLAIQSVWAFASALRNAVPMRSKLIFNDGYSLLSLRGNPESVRALWISLKDGAEIARGRSTTEMPEEWFEMPTDEQMKKRFVVGFALRRFDRLMDEMRMEEAAALVDHLLNADIALGGNSRYALVCERMFLELIGQNNPETIEKMRTREQMGAMKRMKTNPGVIRTEYAYEMLAKKNQWKANQVRKRFDEMAAKYPYPQMIQSERRLMALVDRMAVSNQDHQE